MKSIVYRNRNPGSEFPRVTSKGDRHAAIAVTVMTPAKYIPVPFRFTAVNCTSAKKKGQIPGASTELHQMADSVKLHTGESSALVHIMRAVPS